MVFLYGLYNFEVLEIGFIYSKVPGKQTIGGDQGMSPDEEIRQDMQSSGKRFMALRTSNCKNLTALRTGNPVFLDFPGIFCPPCTGDIKGFWI